MKKILMAFGMIAAMLSCPAMAQSTTGLMFGGTVGFTKPHGSDNDSGTTIGGRFGKQIQGNVSWEADVNLGVTDGAIGTNRDWNINSVAVYGVYRTDGDIHLKAKLGVAYWDDDFDHDTSLSAGIGVGFRMGRGILDVEYTQINSYVDYVTVGYTLPF
ncbi:MAG TPA: outer membrane beta-barrel protein [Burkholderiales bacterium]|nr:outer membrane beta-barrel protein [Burkholderiales bacterium]